MGCYNLLPVCYLLLICGLSSGQMGPEGTPLGSEAARNRLALQKFLAYQPTSEDLLMLGMNGTVISSRKYENLKEPCKSHMTFYDTSYKYGQLWAMYMYDASTKFPESVLLGGFTHFGNFDECIDVRDVAAPDGSTFHGQHCSAAVVITLKSSSKGMVSTGGFPALTVGTCVPSTCDREDTGLIVKEDFVEKLKSVSPLFSFADITTVIRRDQCQTKEELELDGNDWGVTSFLIIIGVLVVLSTAYDLFTLHSESRINLLLAFSVYTNGSRLFMISTSRSGSTIHCLHGIRFFSMAWVILGHRYGTALVAPSINALSYTNNIYADWKHLWITNGTLSVDTFLVLSGLLVGYMFLQKVPKTNSFNIPMYYIHRLFRLTPALGIMILLQISLLRHAGSGPIWNTFRSLVGNYCEDTWWATLFYVQNYAEEALQKPCLNQAWYLSVDMQLFVLSPLVLIPLWKRPKIGLYFTGALSIAGIISNFVISYLNEFSGTQVGPNAKNTNDYNKMMYNPTHTRFVPYLLGILLGYLLVSHNSRKTAIKYTKVITCLLWVVTGGLLLLTLCIVHVFQQPDYEFDNVSAAFYNALGRPGWSLGVAMVIFLCHTGNGGVIDSFLSWGFFQPLSRLCYSMYLVHVNVVMNQMSTVRTLAYLSDDNVMREYFGDLIITLLLSIVLSLTFESPFMVLEKELLSGRKQKVVERTEAVAVASTSEPKEEQVQEEMSEELPKEKLDV